jgi:hypothetical protein
MLTFFAPCADQKRRKKEHAKIKQAFLSLSADLSTKYNN